MEVTQPDGPALPRGDVIQASLQKRAFLLGKRKYRSSGSRDGMSLDSGLKYDPTTCE